MLQASRRAGGRRRSRTPRDLVVAACAIVAVFVWILLGGGTDRAPVLAATETGMTLCDGTRCVPLLAPASHELPPEWRWELQSYEFEHMYRNAARSPVLLAHSSSSK